MAEQPQQQQPMSYPVPQQPAAVGPGWMVTLLMAVLSFLAGGRWPILTPTDPNAPPVTPPVIPVLPPPVVEPDVPDTPPVDPPDTPPVVELDETGQIAKYAAIGLKPEAYSEFGAIADNYERAALNIDGCFMHDEGDVITWLRVENRSTINDVATVEAFYRAIQQRMDDTFQAGKLGTLADWSREFKSIAAGVRDAARSVEVQK